MKTLKLKLFKNGKRPTQAHESDAGHDCYAVKSMWVLPFMRAVIPLGFAIELEEGYYAEIKGRSGLAGKKGIFAHVGTVDSDYRGQVMAILYNSRLLPYRIKQGDRVAQMIITKHEPARLISVYELGESERGVSGFGSSGR